MIHLSPPSDAIPAQQRCLLCSRLPRHGLGHLIFPDLHAGGELEGLVLCLRCGTSQLGDPRHIETVMKKQVQRIDSIIASRRASLSANELEDLRIDRASCFLLMAQSWDFLGLHSGLWSDQRARAPWSDDQIAYARRLLRRAHVKTHQTRTTSS
jgi:hypothetical protein